MQRMYNGVIRERGDVKEFGRGSGRCDEGSRVRVQVSLYRFADPFLYPGDGRGGLGEKESVFQHTLLIVDIPSSTLRSEWHPNGR